jgi:hypothetical protein
LHSVVKRYFRPWPDFFGRTALCPKPTRKNAEAQRTQRNAENTVGLPKLDDRQPWAGPADFAAGHQDFIFYPDQVGFTRINRRGGGHPCLP